MDQLYPGEIVSDRSRRRALELIAIFVTIPLVISAAAFAGHSAPLLPILWVITIGSYLMWSRSGSSMLNGRATDRAEEWRRIGRRFAISSGALAILFTLLVPEQLFLFPRMSPRIWALVVVLYPIVSVVPQEFLYRTFFYWRYEALFRSEAELRWVNAALFALLHLVFVNWIAVALTFIGGLFFADTYARTRSLWWVTAEHTIYGWVVITLGLGSYLYFPTALSISALFQ